jgi:subtilisin family serine protease
MKRVSTVLTLVMVLGGCGHFSQSVPVARMAQAASPFDARAFSASGESTRRAVVRLKGVNVPQALRRQDAGSPKVVSKIGPLRTLVIDAGAPAKLDAVLKSLQGDREVVYAAPTNLVVAEKVVDDPKVGEQYALGVTRAFDGWDIEWGKADTVVAIVDSGVDMRHPDLAGKIVPTSYNVLDRNNNPADDHGHGTHCAGIATAIANNQTGIAGVAPGCGLMAVKVLDTKGRGDDASIAEGIVYAVDNGADVISMSLGLYKRSQVIEDALQYALNKDVVLVASAGNNNALNDPKTAPHLPSTHPGVIEVAATDAKDAKASFSNFGKTVSVAAPGVAILSTLPTYSVGRATQGYGPMSGTSMAAPFVAGLAGLVRSQFPQLKQAEVKARIEASADDLGETGFDPKFGYGRVNVAKALAAAGVQQRR